MLGPNMTTLTYAVSRALADDLEGRRRGRGVPARPRRQRAAVDRAAAKSAGAVVRWAEVDIETCELPEWQYDELITGRTRLVAVTAASNAVGTRPDVRAIAERAHRVGALTYVDGVHATAARPGRHGGRRGRLLGHQRVQVVWSAHRAAVVAAPAAAGDAVSGQAGALAGRGAGPVRDRDAAVRADGRRGRRRRPPGRAGRRRDRLAAAAGARLDGGGPALRGVGVLPAGQRPAQPPARVRARLATGPGADRVVLGRGLEAARGHRGSWPGAGSAPGTATTTRTS